METKKTKIEINKNYMNKTKTVKKTVAKSKTQANNSVTPIPVMVQKRGRGRPSGSSSLSVVSLEDLVAKLPSNATLPLSNVVIRSLANVGVKLNSTPFKAAGNAIGEITKQYSKTSNVAIVNLNEPETAAV